MAASNKVIDAEDEDKLAGGVSTGKETGKGDSGGGDGSRAAPGSGGAASVPAAAAAARGVAGGQGKTEEGEALIVVSARCQREDWPRGLLREAAETRNNVCCVSVLSQLSTGGLATGIVERDSRNAQVTVGVRVCGGSKSARTTDNRPITPDKEEQF